MVTISHHFSISFYINKPLPILIEKNYQTQIFIARVNKGIMQVKVHHIRSENHDKSQSTFKAFTASVEPPYMGILMKPSPFQWEEIMEEGFVRLSFPGQDMVFDLKVKYRIEVGENTIFFVTGDQTEFEEKVKEFEKQEN